MNPTWTCTTPPILSFCSSVLCPDLLEDLHQNGYQSCIDDLPNLGVLASCDVGHCPGCFFLDVGLVVTEQARQHLQGTWIQNTLGLLISAGHNVAKWPQCWSLRGRRNIATSSAHMTWDFTPVKQHYNSTERFSTSAGLNTLLLRLNSYYGINYQIRCKSRNEKNSLNILAVAINEEEHCRRYINCTFQWQHWHKDSSVSTYHNRELPTG